MNKDALLIKITEGFFKNAEQNKLEVVYGENLKFIAWSISKNDNLKNFLDNPFISLSEKNEALDNIFGDVINSDVLRFAKILLEQNLLNLKTKNQLYLWTCITSFLMVLLYLYLILL